MSVKFALKFQAIAEKTAKKYLEIILAAPWWLLRARILVHSYIRIMLLIRRILAHFGSFLNFMHYRPVFSCNNSARSPLYARHQISTSRLTSFRGSRYREEFCPQINAQVNV